MGDRSAPIGTHRSAFRNRALVRLALAHSLAVMAEWGIFIAALVAVFERDGALAAGYASIALQLAYVVFAPAAGALAQRFAAHHMRFGGLLVQSLAYGAAAIAAATGLPSVAVVAGSVIAIGAVTSLRPSGAALLPATARNSRELTVANLWIGYADGVALIGGPLVVAVLLVVGDAAIAIGGCAALALIGAVVSVSRSSSAPPPAPPETDHTLALALLRRNLRAVVARPGVAGVLVAVTSQNFMLGALDMVVVVLAEDHIDLGEGGAAVLVTLFGFGALVGGVLTGALVRRRRLAPLLGLAILAIGISSIAFGLAVTVLAALIVMPTLGVARTVLDRLATLLLHRSSPPDALGALFTVIEFTAGIGLFVGSVAAQILVAVSGAEAALVGTGVFYVAVFVATFRSLAVADGSADVPVVQMSLLRRSPVFRLLPQCELEDLGRAAREIDVASGETVIRQGDVGDRFYVVADGEFDALVDGAAVGSIERGGCFGEIALLADEPRMATVVARTQGSLLSVDRTPFLVAVTGHDSTQREAWGVVALRRGRTPEGDAPPNRSGGR